MYKQKSALFLLCETPLHAGSGDDLGLVDLPIQRERHTTFPKIEASSLKGALREAFEHTPGKEKDADFQINVHRVFGYDDAFEKHTSTAYDSAAVKKYFNADKETDKEKNTQFSGCLALTDARLLLFPVKSMKGVFVWLTCPQVLNKFASDMAIAGVNIAHLGNIKSLDIAEGNAVTASSATLIDKAVVLEEFAFDAVVSEAVAGFALALSDIVFTDKTLAYWKGLLQKNLIVLNDTDFRDFTNISTEVITRTKIDNETGTVADGALFTEEYLPTDSVLYALAVTSDEFAKKDKKDYKTATVVMDFFGNNLQSIFQLGGNATLGKGILRTKLLQGTSNGQ